MATFTARSINTILLIWLLLPSQCVRHEEELDKLISEVDESDTSKGLAARVKFHGEDKINDLVRVINERTEGSNKVNASQLYEDISWLVPCPVAGAMVKYVLRDALLENKNHLGFVNAGELQKALMKGTGMTENFASFSAGGIAAYAVTDIHQVERDLARRVASLLFMQASNWFLSILGTASGLNLLTMNNADRCPDPTKLEQGKVWWKFWTWGRPDTLRVQINNFNDRQVEGQIMNFPCNGNVRHQQHGFSTNIRAVEFDEGNTVDESWLPRDGTNRGSPVRVSRTKRFESWLPRDGKVLTKIPKRKPDEWEMTLGGLAELMKRMQPNGEKDSEFSELRKCGDCYEAVPTEDVPEPEGIGAKGNPRLALTQWQAWLVWPGFFTYYSLPWPQENATHWGEGRSISETDLKNVFLNSAYREGFMDKIEDKSVSWGIKETIKVMHELGVHWKKREVKPDFLKLMDFHLYPKIKKGCTEDQAFQGWMEFTKDTLKAMSGKCDAASWRGKCDVERS